MRPGNFRVIYKGPVQLHNFIPAISYPRWQPCRPFTVFLQVYLTDCSGQEEKCLPSNIVSLCIFMDPDLFFNFYFLAVPDEAPVIRSVKPSTTTSVLVQWQV